MSVSIQLTEDFVLLPQHSHASAQLRRDVRRQREESRSRSASRGRGQRAVSPLRASGSATPLAAGSATPAASTSRAATPRGRSTERRTEDEDDQPTPTAFIRGLLTLTLTKPSRIRKITLRLKGLGRTEWPEGIGPRRIEISEDHTIFAKSFPLFSASASVPGLRRSNSVETLGIQEERQSRRDQHLRATGARASSVMPSREMSVDRAAYIASRDAADQAYWQDPPPSFSASPHGSPALRPLTTVTSSSSHARIGSRPSVSRSSTFNGEQTLETHVENSFSPLPTPENEDAFALPPPANGSSSAPVSSTARSSFEGAHEERDPTPPAARPSYQTTASAQRPSPRAAKENGSHARFSLTSLLKNRDRSESRQRESSPGPAGRSRSRGRQMNLKAIRDVLTSTADTTRSPAESDEDDEPSSQHNWREFKAGRYVWPIQIPVPVTLPPSMSAIFGSNTYTLKAVVKRVGALTPNLTTETRVELVSSPGEDDTEETDTIVIERLWEYQMRYLITLSGKAFPVGGQIPISIRLNPMAKVKLYRITATVEEKVSYYAHGRRIARHEGVKRFQLCKVDHVVEEGELPKPLLPVFSNDTSALLGSPLASWIINATANDEHAPRLLDPIGPWELETNLQLPNCKSRIHFSIKHPQSNIESSHVFKLVLRVERGDREILDAKGNPKKFDIVIECPIVLLSCRNAANMLPPYTTAGSSNAPTARSETCGCPASVSQDALARQQHFARLVAGAESPSGETPPAYTSEPSPARSTSQASPSPVRSGSEPTSRGRRASIGSRIFRPTPS